MSLIGSGIVANSTINMAIQGLNNMFAPLLSPGSAWDGTEASGFATKPADPERITAKPALRLLTPPRQWFTDTLLVGVDAWANNQGTLTNCGLQKVIFHFEGGTAEIDTPSFQSFVGANGETRTYFGWWVRLRKPAQQAGFGNLYVEAVPADPNMQSRVIGPHLFAPQNIQHDIELEVNPSTVELDGVRYRSMDAATTYLKTQSPQNPRIHITQSGKYEMLAEEGISFTDMKGRLAIEASVPGVSLGRNSYTNDSDARIKNNAFPIEVRGSNITIDFANVIDFKGGLGSYGDGMHWFNGCKITSTSPEGRFEHLRGGVIDLAGRRIGGFPWLTECTISRIAASLGKVNLARGCMIQEVSYDIASDSKCVIDCIITDQSDVWWNQDHKTLLLEYTGQEATATFERDDNTVDTVQTFTATWGTNSATFTCGKSEQYFNGTLGDGYSVQDLVGWVNSLPGWNANLSVPDDQSVFADLRNQRATRVSTALKSSRGFDPVDVKDSPLQLFIGYNRHGDFYQHSVGEEENIIIRGNRVEGEVQSVFIGPIPHNSPAEEPRPKDMVFLNNIFDVSTAVHTYYDSSILASQIGKRDVHTSHLVLAHNSWINQGLIIRSDSSGFDMLGYELIANNVLRELRFVGAEDNEVTIASNHIYGATSAPNIAVDTSYGGLVPTVFADPENGDFSPSGPLLKAGFAPVAPFDINGADFPQPFATPGAIAAEASAFIPGTGAGTGSTDPVADLLDLINTSGGQSSFHDYSNANTGSVWISSDQSALNNDHTQSVNSRQPTVTADGAAFDGINDFVSQSISGGAFTVAMSVSVNEDISGTFLSTDSNAVLVQYFEGSASGHAGIVRIDGVIRGTRDDVFQAVQNAGEVLLMITGMDLSGATSLRVGRGSGTMDATVRRIAVLDEDALSTNLEAARALAVEAIAVA